MKNTILGLVFGLLIGFVGTVFANDIALAPVMNGPVEVECITPTPNDSTPVPTSTPEPTITANPSLTPEPTAVVKTKCNQGIGNKAEGCDPGNSNHNQPSNDEGGRLPGTPGPRGK